ncbi:serine/threonine-protein phosphatase 4 regulatory subunit 1-like isoform X2 [Protopterus annectens]|uniref:serine/threonine-protein phosphatase 4 regulatory subunit 1-like isoform X2 n=1 Tax=Protopterus annectens TaxID=7888 RepID=UPI001CFB1C98|nr:serine/threonine-protein phosphatase 4 regulatory subunit 1-like isoform X2 [Protopterus annectens]
MAGIPLYFVETQDDLDDFGFEDYGSECDGIRITAFLDVAGQDNLTPLARLEKYAFSENLFNRQIVARGLLDVLRSFSDDEKDFLAVMEIVLRLSEDAEPTVRAELMEQVPHIAFFLQENKGRFPTAFSKYLVPVVVRYLTDPNNQVRKTSQAALLVLLEQNFIDKNDIEAKVCPILLELAAPDSDDDYKVEAVAIICKMSCMLSKEIVEKLLLPRFCDLCSDERLFQVRKVCAANFGDICNTVGQEATEKYLIPRFFELCSDNVWGIRKACADCFMAVSCSASPEMRRTKLSPLFINLICDPSKWVRQAAFQSLGPFISTFANPSSAGLYIKDDGTLSIRQLNEDTRSVSSSDKNAPNCHTSNCNSEKVDSIEASVRLSPGNNTPCSVETLQDTMEEKSKNVTEAQTSVFDGTSIDASKLPLSTCTDDKPCISENGSKSNGQASGSGGEQNMTTECCLASHQLPVDNFNSFYYWRPPLPDISQELELLHLDAKQQEATEESHSQIQVLSAALRVAQLDCQPEDELKDQEESYSNLLSGECSLSSCSLTDEKNVAVSESPFGEHASQTMNSEDWQNESTESSDKEDDNELLFGEEKFKVQDIIPQPLLEQYLSMTDPARAQTVDTEIAKHCAYSLPGVALTLGRKNWHCLKDTYETLASDVQWKVRRTLAFSIHELAVILGDQLTAADLVPIFNGFLKDLDEVRIGVLKHLYDFLKLLHEDKRREYLYQLQEFMVTDNSRNWRFRYELAEQLILILELYNPTDVYDYLRHIALTLCSDKVSEVRWISFKLVVAILQKFYSNGTSALGLNFINELTLKFRHCPKWVGRQAFAFICQAAVEAECMPVDQFVEHLLPNLLSLASDRVANVRVLLAKALRQTLLQKVYFTSVGNPHLEEVEETVLVLQSDGDKDVRYFATVEPAQNPVGLTTFVN